MLTHQYNQELALTRAKFDEVYRILEKSLSVATDMADKIIQLQLRVEELEANQAFDHNQIKQLKAKLDKVYP